MHVWTQRVTDNTNRDMAELRKEMNEKLEKMMREERILKKYSQFLTEKITSKLH